MNHIACPMMLSLFEIRENIPNSRNFQVLSNESKRIVNYCLETICYRAPFLWGPFKNNVTAKMLNFRPPPPYVTISHFFSLYPLTPCH